MSKSKKKRKLPKRVLALPDMEQSKSAVLNSLTSKSGHESTTTPPMVLSSGIARSHA